MKIKDMPIEELELMSLTDLTYMILKENKKSMNTPTLFKEICNLLSYSDSDYASKIGDYYTSLNIDKRFVLLDNNEWDIRDNHVLDISLEEEEELESEEEEETEDNENIEEDCEDIDNVIDEDELDDDVDDDIEELAVLDEDEMGEEE